MNDADIARIKSEIRAILSDCGVTLGDQARTQIVERLYQLVANARLRGANDTWSTLNEMVGMAKPPPIKT